MSDSPSTFTLGDGVTEVDIPTSPDSIRFIPSADGETSDSDSNSDSDSDSKDSDEAAIWHFSSVQDEFLYEHVTGAKLASKQ